MLQTHWADTAQLSDTEPVYALGRHLLGDGQQTTVYVVSHPLGTTRARVVHLAESRPLASWCRQNEVDEALIGGFYVTPAGPPLGELWIDGTRLATEPFLSPFAGLRACLHISCGQVVIARRPQLPIEIVGDLLQAGPLLVADYRSVWPDEDDVEGFSAGACQFDSDITSGRYPRAALGASESHLIAVACDGRRSGLDAGLTMLELAQLMQQLGCKEALNLDGGGSTALIHRGHLLNRQYSHLDVPLEEGRSISTAIVFDSTTD